MKSINKLTTIFTVAALLWVCHKNMPGTKTPAIKQETAKVVNFPKLYNLVKAFETCKLKTYHDCRGIKTIGWGHTGKDVKEHKKISPEVADKLLAQDVKIAYNIVTKHVKHRLSSDQTIAITSFVYNVGPGSPCKDGFVRTKEGKPSRVLTLLNRGKIKAAAEEMKKWCYAGKKQVGGLKKRRHQESQLLLSYN